jgi:hypothetical protein
VTPPGHDRKSSFERILLTWNGSREAACDLAESLPHLRIARAVIICVVAAPVEAQARLGLDAKHHFKYHGIAAILHYGDKGEGDVGEALIAEARRQRADLVVIGATAILVSANGCSAALPTSYCIRVHCRSCSRIKELKADDET